MYMTYGEFLDKFKEENKTYHYYYSFDDPPGSLKDDYELPELMSSLLDISKVTYWHGHGTITRPHTDAMENMMCVFEGYKIFYIVAAYDRQHIYCGDGGIPDNYSPIEFFDPDYEKYPDFKNAHVLKARIEPGDCLFVPAYWFHQVESSPGVSIGVASFFKTYHAVVDVLQAGLQKKII